MQALIVKEDTPLSDAVYQFANNHDLRGIFLIDKNDQLSGVINKRDLLNWVKIQLSVPSAGQLMSIGEMRRLVNAQRIADLATIGSKNAAVRLDETVADALEKMTSYDFADIPVVDADGRIVNDLRLSEILAYMLDNN
jgi:CBS domain-containing protein